MHDDLAEIRRRVGFLTELAILAGAAVFAYLVYRAAAYKFFLGTAAAGFSGLIALVVGSFVLTHLRDARGFNANSTVMMIGLVAATGGGGWFLWHHWPMVVDNLGLIGAFAVVLAALFGLIIRLRGRAP